MGAHSLDVSPILLPLLLTLRAFIRVAVLMHLNIISSFTSSSTLSRYLRGVQVSFQFPDLCPFLHLNHSFMFQAAILWMVRWTVIKAYQSHSRLTASLCN
ncbi:hypothetical protein KP509_21G083800 [Ceratopteris richardii]|uniref:Uncharacterized protein n=1 Tax=Ceratopteris richardii TaxID=49495 RepID=A0A8T2SEZ3_CERRI|nr:hypothetical protein KP509_21G083800 [Ceratopteris richardii]